MALGISAADAEGVSLCAFGSFSLMGGYYLLQPMSDAMALRVGVENTPYVTAGGLVLIMVCNPLYAWLVRTVRWELVQPILHRILSVCLIAFAIAFGFSRMATAESTGTILLSAGFATFTGAFSLFLMSTFWVRMAHVSMLQVSNLS